MEKVSHVVVGWRQKLDQNGHRGEGEEVFPWLAVSVMTCARKFRSFASEASLEA